ncbi:TadE/TadG family type IV pilus assembly protein [Qipengyuania sphaerica]|uniref:TadE/TadG family type IV pilus assembly protein n=1 Tax=Qipengyuania sphaerica TaxID=2867243 RepID=UPI001C885516|nr:TadE family protein [Qipengyuania sphaerica]MBX7541292.1 pilus assembly protein [Qipengyuania sphaerica]
MTRFVAFLRDVRGATAAEFAMVVPIMIIFLFGIMDAGFYAWTLNQGEKATQMGARWAVATDMVPSDLRTYSFATSGGISQGEVVPQSAFPGVTCTNTGCTCKGTCSFGLNRDAAAFDQIVARMQDYYADIEAENVQIDYDWSGLGFSGDPNGPDVAPIVTVRLIDMQHDPLFGLLIGSFGLPDFAYSLTAEDSEGTFSN